jgi:hypothetical protein
MGKLRSNFKKTEHVLYNNNNQNRTEVATILFERPGLFNQISNGSQPRRLLILLPGMEVETNCPSERAKRVSHFFEFFSLTSP